MGKILDYQSNYDKISNNKYIENITFYVEYFIKECNII